MKFFMFDICSLVASASVFNVVTGNHIKIVLRFLFCCRLKINQLVRCFEPATVMINKAPENSESF